MPVICKNCGLIDDYRTEMKAKNMVAFCNGCDKYIKNLPYSPPSLHFGKYKGPVIVQIEDVDYLEWVRSKVKLSEIIRHAVDQQISSLRMTHV